MMNNKKNSSQILVLALILMIAVGLQILTRLVSKNQDNRSKAAGTSTYGTSCSSNSDCASGMCTYTQSISGHNYTFISNTAVCSSVASDAACTSLGGSCTASYTKYDNIGGQGCTTNNGLSGFVVLNLCLATNESRCCVPTKKCSGSNMITTSYSTSNNGITTTTTSCSGGCSQSGSSVICSQATPVTPSIPTSVVESPQISFKIAFEGVTPNVKCLDNFKTVELIVGKSGTDVDSMLVDISPIGGETNNEGLQVFGVSNIELSNTLAGANNVYVRIKGQEHLRMYYCLKGQSSKTTSQTCSVGFGSIINNFSQYPILAGDIDRDGAVTVIDFSTLKIDLFETGCGYKTDLSGDAIINDFDIKLLKNGLKEKYDQ